MAKEEKTKTDDTKVKSAKSESKPQGGKPKGQAKGAVAEPTAKEAAPKTAIKVMPRLLERYRKEISATLMKEFGYSNPMQVPHVNKVIVNVGVGEALANAKALDSTVRDLTIIAGQKPIVRKAKKSIATFKLREGNAVGVKVTLRGYRMYDFLDRLVNTALPRVRDFRGIPRDAFDGRGNYTLGLREQLIFPEIDYDTIDKLRGMEITIVTNAKNDEEARRLLQLMGMPFRQS